MILATPQGNREVRLFEAAGFIPRPGTSQANWSGSLPELGISAVAASVRLVSEEIAGFVMRTFTGEGQMNRVPVYDDPTALLFQAPAESWTSFDVWSDTIAALELEENAFLWKTMNKQGRVLELYPIDPAYVQVTLKNGVKTVMARINGALQDVTKSVVHIRAWAPGPQAEGVSTLRMHSTALKVAQSYDLYRGRYLDNDGTPGIVLEVPGSPDKVKRGEMLDAWWKRHGGVYNVGKPGIAWGGMTVRQLSPNLRDSQAAEIADSMVRDIGRMFRIFPLELLHGEIKGSPRTAEDTSDIFVRFSLLHRMRRVERALAADPNLYPNKTRYPRFDVSELLRSDQATAATIAHNLIQVGAITKDEGRAMVNLEPLPDGQGDKVIEIPVGGGGQMLPYPVKPVAGGDENTN